MGRIVVSENVTLDGVIEDPVGDEGQSFGGWFDPATAPDAAAWAQAETEEALEAAAMLLGRRTYDAFAARWPARQGAWADRLNSMPKYVLSSTLTDPRWNNTTVLKDGPSEAAAHLKREIDGDVVVYGSGRLVRPLMEDDLVDELRLILHPVVAGSGWRLFGATAGSRQWSRVSTRTVGDGLTQVVYRPVRDA
ncbi:dihydrofolate reductase family protein [Actinomadura rupiterrae]|uniref:dihydrofolate reductase family protein n=1 Tax=Actinomadura rupiterrae TaxID=559627 RepID=UPI0020A45206|nr:dihydrofolate reductase family protein [Actinomadura rupiterrae]MCP2342521.1 dihydrofolate reductase [Actinomadura rupiterrae]